MKRWLNTLSQIVAGISLMLCAALAVSQNDKGGEEGQASQATPPTKTSPPPQRVTINPHKKYVDLLAKEVDKKDLRWIEAEGEKFLTLWQPDKTGNPFGAVLIIHGEGHVIDSPYEIHALRNNLSHHGWATLVIHLPPPPEGNIPERPTPTPKPENSDTADDTEETPKQNGEESGEVSGEESREKQTKAEPKIDPRNSKKDKPAPPPLPLASPAPNPEETSDARIAAAIKYLNQQGQYNLVFVGHGLGAVRAARFLDAMEQPRQRSTRAGSKAVRNLRALVMISARNQIPETDHTLEDYLNDRDIPILDLYFGDHFLDDIETKERREIAARAQVKNFYQVQITRPISRGDEAENLLTRRVRGFLNKFAKGVEVGKKR